ncbi:UNVERIFIED_CONTAM: hypothetical protein FKN15_008165 [Acipenser sinensis]
MWDRCFNIGRNLIYGGFRWPPMWDRCFNIGRNLIYGGFRLVATLYLSREYENIERAVPEYEAKWAFGESFEE